MSVKRNVTVPPGKDTPLPYKRESPGGRDEPVPLTAPKPPSCGADHERSCRVCRCDRFERAAMNRLASETSPYLLQHASNPVDWYPWGEEALERARSEDKPIRSEERRVGKEC